MNQAHHAKLRHAGWHYDPLSDRYSAPGVPLDGTQRMYTQAEAWDAHEQASTSKEKPSAVRTKETSDAPTS